jgi:hypothetical protein
VVHGHGAGILRRMVADVCRSHPAPTTAPGRIRRHGGGFRSQWVMTRSRSRPRSRSELEQGRKGAGEKGRTDPAASFPLSPFPPCPPAPCPPAPCPPAPLLPRSPASSMRE